MDIPITEEALLFSLLPTHSLTGNTGKIERIDRGC
jgi:hypothetical protein